MEEKAKKDLEPYVTPEIIVYNLELEQSILSGSDVSAYGALNGGVYDELN